MLQFLSNAGYNKDPKDGTIFRLENSDLGISIHHYVGCGNSWFLSCSALQMSGWNLNTTDFNEAVEKAKEQIATELQKLNESFSAVKDDSDIVIR